MAEYITLITKENDKVRVNASIRGMSKLIEGIVSDSGYNEVIPIEQISKSTLDLIIKYIEENSYKLAAPLSLHNIDHLIDS